MKRNVIRKLVTLTLAGALLLGNALPTAADGADAGTSDGSVAAEEATSEEIDVSDISMPVGDLVLPEINEEETGQLVDDKTIKKMDRAVKAYTPSSESLLINNAKHFYYYEKLNEDEQSLYDTMLLACDDPEGATSAGVYFTDLKPFSAEFWALYGKVYYALLLDHPELFWLYNTNDTDFVLYSSSTLSSGITAVYIELTGGVKDYEKKMTDFNNATNEFLKGIDTKQDKKKVAKAIHDKLNSMVAYDHTVCDDGIYADYAHTAYGALVRNSRGEDHKAVCDGYALAYEYLCQQVGITANVIYGEAGASKNELGGHAWSMVKLDKEWKEVDACWDDVGTREDNLLKVYTKNSDAYKVIMEAYTDKEYGKKLGHYLYRVSTEKISHYTPPKDDIYITKDGRYSVSCLTESYHVRDKEGYTGALMKLAPTAK